VHEDDEWAGTLDFRDGRLRYSSNGNLLWDIPEADVAVVGEFTVSAFGSDYFVVFVTGTGLCFQASFYARGRDAALGSLGAALGSPLVHGLCNSAEFRSRVMWPDALIETPLLSRPVTSIGARVLQSIQFWKDHEVPLSPDVLRHLGVTLR